MKFRGHETFAIRKGWLNKGLKNVNIDPDVFLGDNGNPMDILGIGSNMVKGLRYWMVATNLTSEPNSGKRHQTFTDLGNIIYKNDRYFEEIGSLALVHYEIASNEKNATSWYVFFNEFEYSEFTEQDFIRAVYKYVRMNYEGDLPSERSVSDDFRCIINMYVNKETENPNPEDNIESPFTELGLAEYLYAKSGMRIYRKISPQEIILPDFIALALILKSAEGRKEIKISFLQKEKNSIGKIFNLDVVKILNILYRLETEGYINVVRTAGLDVIKINTDLTYLECIQSYYNKLNNKVGAKI